MKGFSKVIIAGNVTRDPELRTTPGGTQVCSFGVAVNRNFRDSSGNMRDSVSFFDCSAWGKSGEVIAQYVKKGSGIIVSGRLEQRSWDDKSTGQKRSRVEITVEDFTFVGSGERSDGDAGGASATSSTAASTTGGSATSSQEQIPDDIPDAPLDLDEIPF